MTRRYTSDSGMMLIKVGGQFTEVSDSLGWVILFTFCPYRIGRADFIGLFHNYLKTS